MGSPSTGKSGLSGKSSFNGVLDDSSILNNVLRFHSQVINAGLIELIARMQALGRSEVEAWEDFNAMNKAMQRAIELGDKGVAQEAVSEIRDAYQDFCSNPDVSDKDKRTVSKILNDWYPEVLGRENGIRRKELKEMCDKAILECERAGVDSDVWDKFKGAVEDAYTNAMNKKAPLQMEMVKCKAASIPVAQKNLEKAGIQPTIFYGAGNKEAYIVVPKAGKDVEILVRAAVIDAAVKCEQANILSEESMNTIMQLRGVDDRREMSGLTLAEAEAVAETMYGKNAPIVIKEPAEPNGHFSIVFCRENEELVNSVVLQEMIKEKGAGYNAHVGNILETNYKARQGVDLLVSKISEGKDTFGYVIDADHPDHYLLVTPKGIAECYENGEKEFTRFDKMPNPTNYSIELKERTMQLAPRIMFLPAKEAKACGLTRDEYSVTEELKQKLETVKNPNNKVVTAERGTKDENDKYKREVQAAVSTQTMFARYAVTQARNNLPEKASLRMLTQYVTQNSSELISAYKHECMKNIESKNMSQEEKNKAIHRLDYSIKSLRGQTQLDVSVEAAMKEVYNQIAPVDARIQVEDYHPPMFTASRLDSTTIDDKEVMEFRQNMKQITAVLDHYSTGDKQPTEEAKTAEAEKAQTRSEAAKDNHYEKASAQNEAERPQTAKRVPELNAVPINDRINKNEQMVQSYARQMSDKSRNLSKAKIEAIAVSNVYMVNMRAAVLDGADLPPVDKYLKEYGIVPEETFGRISEEFEKEFGINLEQYYNGEVAEENKDLLTEEIKRITKEEVQKDISKGIQERKEKAAKTKEAADRDDER